MASSKALIGQSAPAFKTTALVNGQFKDVSLSDYKVGEKRVDLLLQHVRLPNGDHRVQLFRKTIFEIGSERSDEFAKLNCQVIAASTDSQFSHLAWVNTPRKEGGLGAMKIPILADTSHSVSKDYGVLKEDQGIAFRGLFIIDNRGILRQITINDLPVGRDVDETLRLVQAFQYTDKHGEVCPMGWKPGKKTIKPSVKESKEYFSQVA